jgi:hypothetical protein
MPHVYLLSEDDFDDQVYVYLLETLLSVPVEPIPRRLRRGGGIGEVRKKLPLLLSQLRRTGPTEDTFFLIGIDNDRAIEHPSHERLVHTRVETCRYCALTRAIHTGLSDGWPIPGAIALPVQMIESWLLLMHDPVLYPQESTLPACAWSHQEAARALYGAHPPPQLKDLVAASLRASHQSRTKADFALECVLRLDAEGLAARSPSFDRFRREVSQLFAHSIIPAGVDG